MSFVRHFPVPLIIGVCTILALVSCRLSAPREQPPEEVLKRAIVNNALLEHVAVSGRIHVTSRSFSGSLLFTGGIQGGGVSWWGEGFLHLLHTSPVERSSFSGSLTLLSLDHRTLGVRIDSASGILGDRLLSTIVRSDTAPWLLFTFATGSVALPFASHVAPENVDALTSKLRIVSASPLTKTSFRSPYVYHVTVATTADDQDQSASWRGDLVIDGTTFELLSAHWKPSGSSTSSSLHIDDIDVSFSDRILVTKPRIEGAVVPLTFESLTDIILGKTLLP